MVRGGASPVTLAGNGRRGVCAATADARPPRLARLIAIRTAVVRRRIIRSFLRNEDVMRMALLDRRRAHLNEPRARPQLFNRPGPAVTHAGPQSSDHLLHKRSEGSFVRHPPLDSLGHELGVRLAGLTIAIAATRRHCSE